jgi:hypothetical protein
MKVTMRGGLPVFLAVMSLLAVLASSALGCTCESPSDAKTVRDLAVWYSEGANSSEIIFEGVVENQRLLAGTVDARQNSASPSTVSPQRVISFRVLRAYRGDVSGLVTVLTASSDADCGFDFDTGSQYLVYADRVDDNTLRTSICTGTSLSQHAAPALRVLRGEDPTPDDLLDAKSYYDKFAPQWTGTVCGRIIKPDGTPLAKAWIELTQVRDDTLLPNTAAESATANSDGTFSIRYIRPGKYLLTAERLDSKDYLRWSGYYPGVMAHAEAKLIEVHAGENLSDIQFAVGKVRVHTVLFRIVTSDGSALPLKQLGVSVDAAERDALSYHLAQNRTVKGVYPAGYVPQGRYLVQTYIRPEVRAGKIPAELAKWQMAKKEVNISSDSEVILKLTRAD